MNLIVCIDNHNGMAFHNRRQSQDRILREQLFQMIGSRRLWMNSYSRKQFTETVPTEICTAEDFLEKAGPGDYCFVENLDISPYAKQVETLVLFRWNRDYPADLFFRLDLGSWTLIKSLDFTGFSHKVITKEIYAR